MEGTGVGSMVGTRLGLNVGLSVGREGAAVGWPVGSGVGSQVFSMHRNGRRKPQSPSVHFPVFLCKSTQFCDCELGSP